MNAWVLVININNDVKEVTNGNQNCDTGHILILVVCQGEGILVCLSCCLGPDYSKLYDSMTIFARCEVLA